MGLDESGALESTSPALELERKSPTPSSDRESVLMILRDLIEDLRYGGEARKDQSALQTYRGVIAKAAPRVNRSVKLMSGDLVHWMNRGGPWRAFLILSVRHPSLFLGLHQFYRCSL